MTSDANTGNVQMAAHTYLGRKNRDEHPVGRFDNAGRWRPSPEEECFCCSGLRNPSRAYPFSLMLHCRTAEHISNKFGVDRLELLRAAKELERASAKRVHLAKAA